MTEPMQTEKRSDDTAAQARRTNLIILAAAAFLFVASFTALAYGIKKVNDVADRNTRVICGLKAGYEEQLDSNKKFTKANPRGGVLLGVKFTRDDLDQQRAGLEKRLRDIKDASC